MWLGVDMARKHCQILAGNGFPVRPRASLRKREAILSTFLATGLPRGLVKWNKLSKKLAAGRLGPLASASSSACGTLDTRGHLAGFLRHRNGSFYKDRTGTAQHHRTN